MFLRHLVETVQLWRETVIRCITAFFFLSMPLFKQNILSYTVKLNAWTFKSYHHPIFTVFTWNVMQCYMSNAAVFDYLWHYFLKMSLPYLLMYLYVYFTYILLSGMEKLINKS